MDDLAVVQAKLLYHWNTEPIKLRIQIDQVDTSYTYLKVQSSA